MDSRKTPYVTVTLGVLLLLTLLIAQRTLRQDSAIVLPERITETETNDGGGSENEFNVLSVTPQTVQAAISTLSRPLSYKRTQTVEIFWNGGKSASTSQVAVRGGVTRIDMTLTDSSVCHTLMTADTVAVWYDDEEAWTTLRADQFSADSLQRIPTYETVLDLPVSSIAQAEYSEKDGVYCIYVKTCPDKDGYADSYWVSAQSGLLFAAERTSNDALIYRFSATEPESEAPDEDLFLLPDGSHLPNQ